MRRRELPRGIRFITFSCQRRLPLLRHPAIADVFTDSLARTTAAHPFDLFAWVVMPEHVHLLVRPRGGVPLDRVLLAVMLPPRNVFASSHAARLSQHESPTAALT